MNNKYTRCTYFFLGDNSYNNNNDNNHNIVYELCTTVHKYQFNFDIELTSNIDRY